MSIEIQLNAYERVLRRFSFGPNPETVQAQSATVSGWLTEQLTIVEQASAELQPLLDQASYPITYVAGPRFPAVDEPKRPLRRLNASPAELVSIAYASFDEVSVTERTRVLDEHVLATILRQLNSRAQLFEMLVHFWSDHFYVAAGGDFRVAAMMPLLDRAIRSHAMGNFSGLLNAVCHQPATLIYLDQHQSVAPRPNENFAREIMELYAMGPAEQGNSGTAEQPAYGEPDVKALAAAFSGWTFGFGQAIQGTEQRAPMSGEFVFLPSWHVAGEKQFLGQSLGEAGVAQGERALKMIAQHERTAAFICRKLAQRFICENPPEALVQALRDVWMQEQQSPDQIAKVITTLVLLSENYHQLKKFRRPFEYLMAALRPIHREINVTGLFIYLLRRTGQPAYEWPSPEGYPDVEAAWLTREQMLWRFNGAAFIVHGGVSVGDELFDIRTFDAWSPGLIAKCYKSSAFDENVIAQTIAAPAVRTSLQTSTQRALSDVFISTAFQYR